MLDSVFDNYNRRCALCKNIDIIEFHRIIPVMAGGKTRKKNIIPLCKKCHKKTDSWCINFRIYKNIYDNKNIHNKTKRDINV